MDLIKAQVRAVNELKKHGLAEQGWTFAFDRATSRLGQCDFGKKRITISKYFTGAATLEQFEQTLFHEVAHALLPVAAKHGWQWKRKAREIGHHTGARTAHNPYHEQQTRNRVDILTRKVAGSGNPPATRVLVAALSATKGAPVVGDMLVMPNGVKLEVKEVTPRQTKAVEILGGAEWNLSTPDAYRFLQP